MENDNEAHSAPVKIEALDEALCESQAAPPSSQLAVHLLAPESGCGNLDLPPSPPPLPLVSESVVPEIHEELSMEMAPHVHQITNEPPLKKRRNMHQKPDQSIEACKIEVETVPLVSGTAEIVTHGEEQMEAPPGSDTIVSSGQRGTITRDTPSGVFASTIEDGQPRLKQMLASVENKTESPISNSTRSFLQNSSARRVLEVNELMHSAVPPLSPPGFGSRIPIIA